MESALNFRARMGIAIAGGYLDAFFIHRPRFLYAAQFFEGLPAMKIRRGIIIIPLKKSSKFGDSLRQVAALNIFHSKPVAGEGVVGVLGDHLLQDAEAICCHLRSIL